MHHLYPLLRAADQSMRVGNVHFIKVVNVFFLDLSRLLKPSCHCCLRRYEVRRTARTSTSTRGTSRSLRTKRPAGTRTSELPCQGIPETSRSQRAHRCGVPYDGIGRWAIITSATSSEDAWGLTLGESTSTFTATLLQSYKGKSAPRRCRTPLNNRVLKPRCYVEVAKGSWHCGLQGGWLLLHTPENVPRTKYSCDVLRRTEEHITKIDVLGPSQLYYRIYVSNGFFFCWA